MRWFVVLFLFIDLFLEGSTPLSDYEGAPEVATTEGLPSSLVNQSVCVISGQYIDSVIDLVIPGPEPLVMQRHYGNQADGNIGGFWSFNHFARMAAGKALYQKEQPIWVLALREPSGSQFDYIYPQSREATKKKHLQFQLIVPSALSIFNFRID
jgi:hypothetical protein